MKAVRLTVPATIPASRTIRFTLDGAVREIPLPPGARPGQTLDLQVPAAPPTPVKKKSSSWFGSKKTAAEKQQIKQQKAAEKVLKELQASPAFADRKIVTEVEPAETFYPAEDYHQDYIEKTGRACHVDIDGAFKAADLQPLANPADH